jgi:hypothetical protein
VAGQELENVREADAVLILKSYYVMILTYPEIYHIENGQYHQHKNHSSLLKGKVVPVLN